MLHCPLCKELLFLNENSFCCAQKHVFDRSKDGYVNLLIAKKGTPRVTGDTREMLKARRDFLHKGHFNFLVTALCDALQKILINAQEANDPFTLLDIGCGEGYYINQLNDCLSAKTRAPITYYGLDVSKDAVQMASRACKTAQFFLANVHYEIPIKDRSVSLITGICAPRNFAEFSRILTDRGRLLLVIPSPQHLQELRADYDLLEIDADKEQKLLAQAESFTLTQGSTAESTVTLSPEDIEQVLTMTPNFWHRTQKKSLQSIQTTLSFRLLELELYK